MIGFIFIFNLLWFLDGTKMNESEILLIKWGVKKVDGILRGAPQIKYKHSDSDSDSIEIWKKQNGLGGKLHHQN